MFDLAATDCALLPFPQTAAYATAAQALGARVAEVDLGGRRARMLERPGLRLLLRGPVADGPLCRRALRRLARFPGALVATPEVDLRGFGLIPLMTPAHHAIWDLSGDIRAGMTGKWRNRLAAAERAGVQVAPGGVAAMARLVQAEAAQRAAKGYASLPPAFSLALPARSLRVWEWRQSGRVQAAICLVVEGGSATYHLGWADAAARAAAVHNVMLWQAAYALRAEGVQWLDLGAVCDAAPGLMHFKLGTGARLHRLGHTLLVLPG